MTQEADSHHHLDIEPTNACNAKCYFCPRDKTPHQGIMSQGVWEQTLNRANEFYNTLKEIWGPEAKLQLNFCGLGEPLLNKYTPGFIKDAVDQGYYTTMASNGAVLDAARSQAIVDAGLHEVLINAGEIDGDYDNIYKLPFHKTRDNVLRFKEEHGDACKLSIVLVDHLDDAEHVSKVKTWWQEQGIENFVSFRLINRGGALDGDRFDDKWGQYISEASQIFKKELDHPVACVVPLMSHFVGYDGNYYLCCCDWKKEVILGNVSEHSLASLAQSKLVVGSAREGICKTCSIDPTNLLADKIRAHKEGRIKLFDVKVCQKFGLESDLRARTRAEKFSSVEKQQPIFRSLPIIDTPV